MNNTTRIHEHIHVTIDNVTKEKVWISDYKDTKVVHKQKQSTSKKKVLVEAKKDRALNEICFLMFKNERANKQRDDRRAKRR